MQLNETTANNVDKMARYNWRIKDAQGEMRMIDKSLLKIDDSYQRNVGDSDAKIKRIAANWSWVACGALIVANRGGQLFVVDGQHRARAAMKLSSVRELPCIVFDSDGEMGEAEAFLRANKDRKPMTAIQAFKAMVAAGDKDAVFVKDLLAMHGLRVTQGPKTPGAFQSPGVILGIAKRGHDAASRVLSASIAACSGGAMHGEVIKGLGWIDTMAKDDSLLPKMCPRLSRIGRDSILHSIASAKAFRQAGGEKVCGEGVLNAYNHRLRNKIEL